MRHRRLGSDGPEVSVVCFGTWAAGGAMWGPVDDDEVIGALRAAREAGIDFFDTADAYGWGHAEELIARAFDGKYHGIVVATKGGITRRGSISLNRDYLRKACEASLRRLRTERIDLYQIHWPNDPDTPVDEAWETLCRLQDQGKVDRIGVSNYNVAQLGASERIRHVATVQNEYSMLYRKAEEKVLPWCGEHGTGFLSYGSLAYGILTGKYAPEATFPEEDWRSGSYGFGYWDRLFAPAAFHGHLQRVDALKKVAADLGITTAQLAVAWILRDESVSAAICGAKRASQIEETARAGDVVLDAASLARIEETLTG